MSFLRRQGTRAVRGGRGGRSCCPQRCLYKSRLSFPTPRCGHLFPHTLRHRAEYIDDSLKLVRAIRETIELEASGAKEFDVRRKADPAKEDIQRWIRTWRDSRPVLGEPSYAAISGALRELGRFYQANGSRAQLSGEVRDIVLGELQRAETALI